MNVWADVGRTMCTRAAMSSTKNVAVLLAGGRLLGVFRHSRISDLIPDLRDPWFDRLEAHSGSYSGRIPPCLMYIRSRLQGQEELGYVLEGVFLSTALAFKSVLTYKIALSKVCDTKCACSNYLPRPWIWVKLRYHNLVFHYLQGMQSCKFLVQYLLKGLPSCSKKCLLLRHVQPCWVYLKLFNGFTAIRAC